MKKSVRRVSLTLILGFCMAAVVFTYTRTPTVPEAADSSPASDAPAVGGALDLTRPVPRDQVLDLFRQLFAIPAEDYLNWEESVEAGKIPPDVRAFHEHIVAFNQETEIDPEELSNEGLPFIDLPDGGPRVYPVLKAALGPIIGANVSQEDLNSLLPDLADAQQRVWDFEGQQAEANSDDEPTFTKVHLKPEDLAIARVRDVATPDTVVFEITEGDDPDIFHVQMPPLLDGRHVIGARMSTKPFVSVHIQLTELGSEVLAKVTEEHMGSIFAILIGGEYHAAVAIGGQIKTRNLQLPGGFSEERAEALLAAWSNAAAEDPVE